MINKKIAALRPFETEDIKRAGKGWSEIAKIITGNNIISYENYKQASEQKNILKKHIVEMFDQMDFLSYVKTAKIIHILYSEILRNNGLFQDSLSSVVIKKNEDEIVKCYYNESEVVLCWIPDIQEKQSQLIVGYQEYLRYIEILENMDSEDDVSHFQTKGVEFEFEDVVRKANSLNVSDIHITYSAQFYNIFFKIFGRLEKQTEYIMNIDSGLEFVKKVQLACAEKTKGKFKADEHNYAQDGRIEFENVGNEGVDVRLSIIPGGRLEHFCITARVLKREKLEKTDFKTMGYYSDAIEIMQTVSKRQNGLLLASGVTGSGKSTLIANIITLIDKRKRVYTIEDPIEYTILNQNVTQHQVYEPETGAKMGFKEYASALKRADPDVVSIGEMRKDKELVESIMEMSEAGQLVMSTVHVSSAFSIYSALEQIFNVSSRISVPLILFTINQVLVDKLCSCCKEEDFKKTNIYKLQKMSGEMPYGNLKSLEKLTSFPKTYIKGRGCEKCFNGIEGRTPIYEYMYPNVEMIEWLATEKELPSRFSIEKRACEKGIGVNKLDVYVRRLIDGDVDASDEVLYKLL